MEPRTQRLRIALAALLLGAVGLGSWLWLRSTPYDAARMLHALPEGEAVRGFIDVSLLRSAGVLDQVAGSKAQEEPDYKKFVEETGFDYRKDLEGVAASFQGGASYYVVRGHFDIARLSAYATSHGGSCTGETCWAPGSQPDRKISFAPLSTGVLALAVSPDNRAVSALKPPGGQSPYSTGNSAIWVSVPPSFLSGKSSSPLPAGSRAFLGPLGDAKGVIFTLGPDQTSKTNGFELRLEAECGTVESSAAVATQLTATTDLLRKMLTREKMTPNPADLSGVLTAGRFVSTGSKTTGLWPIERSFLANLASGQIQ